MTPDIDCQVLVVGAGPTGLMAANLLKKAGVDVRVAEPRLAPSTESRALVMLARSIELFASLGLADRLFARGTITTDVEFFISGKKAGGLHFDRAAAVDTPFQFSLAIPQAETERVLLEALSKVGLEVDRDVEIVDFIQDDSGVRLTGKRASGNLISLQAKYVLGADGAHSVVRKKLDLDFEGAEYTQNFLLGDVEVDWSLDRTGFRGFVHGDRLGLFMPLSSTGISRVMATDLDATSASGPSHGELTLAELQDAFVKATCLPVTLKNPAWLTRFHSHHRCVDRFRVGRVFVAGDAAHIHSPAGGQGMNTGLQDAANLAWKLALAIQGYPNADDLLDSYGSERLPVARDVIHLTDSVFNTAAGQTGWVAKVRDALAPIVIGPAASLDAVQRKAFRVFSQIDIEYAPSTAVARQTGNHHPKSVRPGRRAPDAQLSRHRDVFDLLEGYRFHVMAISRARLDERSVEALRAILRTLESDGCAVHLLARLTFAHHDAVEKIERTDLFDRYEVGEEQGQALVVVRPDGYIGWRSDDLEVDGCRDFLEQCGGLRPSAKRTLGQLR